MRFTPKQKVIAPVDFSDSSADAVREAQRCAESPKSVHVVHVLFNLQTATPFTCWDPWEEDLRATQRESAKQHLDEFIKSNEFDGVTPVLLSGDAGHEITKYAKEQDADLIVIPSHGRHGVSRVLLGSTTERVLRHAHCPVYVLRRRDAT